METTDIILEAALEKTIQDLIKARIIDDFQILRSSQNIETTNIDAAIIMVTQEETPELLNEGGNPLEVFECLIEVLSLTPTEDTCDVLHKLKLIDDAMLSGEAPDGLDLSAYQTLAILKGTPTSTEIDEESGRRTRTRSYTIHAQRA